MNRTQNLTAAPRAARKAAAIAFARIFIGVFWLFEVTVGHNWKLGGPGSGPNPGWVGTGAGEVIREDSAQAIADGTWSWFAWFSEALVMPNAEVLSYVIIGLQVLFGVAFILGFLVRPIAVMAIAFDLSVFLLGNSRIPPYFTAAHLFLLVTAAGMYYGADGWIVSRLKDVRTKSADAARFLIDLPLLKPGYRIGALAAVSVAAVYFFLQIPVRETTRMQLVALDIAAILGLVALGLYVAGRIPDRLAVAAAGLRIFIGYKFLHEIWVRTEPGVNALPGWASQEQLTELFRTVADNHWAFFAWIADNIFLTAIPVWAVVFGVVQLVVGVLLILGWRTREASLLGLAFLGGLMIMGMTRYAPFAFGLLVPVLALDGGRVLSVDSAQLRTVEPRYGLPIPTALVPALLALAAVNAVAAAATAFRSGITPDAYVGSMGAMTTAMVAIFSGLFAYVGWLQRKPPLVIDAAEPAATKEPAGTASGPMTSSGASRDSRRT